jgi:hypothetical protein
MSFEKLPTELDVHILQYLGSFDLSSFSQTSKYYRRISESVLYHDITLWSSEHDRVTQLLLTLLHRRDLRPLVKHFQLCHGDEHHELSEQHPTLDIFSDPVDEGLHHSLWAYMVEIKEAVNELALCSGISYQTQNAWFGKVFEVYTFFDGRLSLILALARNMTTLSLSLCVDHPLPMTRFILGDIDWQASEPDVGYPPYQELKVLDISCGAVTGQRRQ